jgi:NADH-quinone oxidoreductase subunit C
MAGPSTQATRIARGKADAEKIFPLLKEKFGDGIVEEVTDTIDPFVVVDAKILYDVAQFVRDEEELNFDLLSLISGVDYLPKDDTEGRIEVVYCLDSTKHLHRLIVKVYLPRENPSVASVEKLWRAADWHERETFDMMGVNFEGHHNLIRILCAEDWEGHPLRKDYVIPESYHGIKNIVY